MSDDDPQEQAEQPSPTPQASNKSTPADLQRRLDALMGDLTELQTYLEERGRQSYELAQRFVANAQRDASSRAYDERQATMLEYQSYIWHEIAGRVGQLLMRYSEDE